MGVRPPQPLASPRPGPRPGPRQLLLLLLLGLTASLTTALGVGCNPEECMLLYDAELQERGLAGPEASTAFCAVLYEFGLCTYSMRRACRGDLQYHSANSMLVHLKTTFECNRRFTTSAPPAGRSTPTTTTSAAPPPAPVEREGQPPPAECSQRKPFKAFKHCGLFGDPHLKTFGGSMQTCRVQGAWPLVDNPFLAVQVTNDHVLEGSPVTATTKVTVLVKGSTTSGPCTAPKTKTYEATAEAPLPHTFIDGTNKSGPGEAVTIRYQETAYGASVEIHIQYIETTIIVRKMGRYLAFSTRMPEELVSWGDDQAEGVDGEGHSPQLCVQGCPQSERLSLSLHRGSVLSWTDALDKCAAKSPLAAGGPTAGTGAYSNEVHGDLTDQYLEWCVFDLMTTGQDDFVLAARSALYDALAMDPGHQRNGTGDTFNAVAPAASTTGAAASSASPSFSLLLLLLLLCGRRVAR